MRRELDGELHIGHLYVPTADSNVATVVIIRIALIERVVSAVDFTTVILASICADGGTVGWGCTSIESATASCFTSALRLALES